MLLVSRVKSFAFYSPVNTGLEIKASTVQQGLFLCCNLLSLCVQGLEKRGGGGERITVSSQASPDVVPSGMRAGLGVDRRGGF